MIRVRKLTALLLVLVLMISLATVSVSAEPSGKYVNKGYQYYSSFGDSIAAGFNLEDFISGVKYRHVKGSFPVIVAEELNVANYEACALAGMRTVEMRMFLEDDYYGDKVTNHVMYYFVEDTEHTAQGIAENRKKYREAIQKSDLITLQIGFNDVWFTMLGTAQLLGRGEAYTGVDQAQDELAGSIDSLGLTEAIEQATDTLLDVLAIPTLVPKVLLAGIQAKQQYFSNYTTILQEIYALNPDITIAAIGYYNPVQTLSPGYDGILDADFAQMNDFVKGLEKDYENFYYIPVEDTESRFDRDHTFDMHPTEAGHVYIADQILETLPDNANPKSSPDPAITDPVCGKFADIDVNQWYHNAVHYVLQNNIMSGTSATAFSPDMAVTRAMMAQMIYAMEGRPSVTGSMPFADVPVTEYYYNAVIFASSNGIMAGMDEKTFSPETMLTREQLATVLRSYAAYKGKDISKSQELTAFHDASSVSFWAEDAVKWAVASGLMSGRDGGVLAPLDPIKRSEVAQMLTNFQKL